VQGEGGFLPATPGFLEGIQEICREHGIVYIDDEVQSGMGRTGEALAVDHFDGIEPDLVVWGKSLGGGLPLAAVSGRAELMDASHVGGLGGTFGGNPLSCVAALATLDQMAEPGFLEGARALGELLFAQLREIASRRPQIGDVRGLGPMVAIELVSDPLTKEPDPATTGRVVALARERGLLLMAAGIYSNVIRVLVPLVADHEQVEAGLEILDGALADAA
jgi:4-aminobutyrate aminotransferase/(S)-3-amino-2-methylpropionate transaminase